MVDFLDTRPRYAEFFAGGGMVSAALGAGWSCAFANDIDEMKCGVFALNWPDTHLVQGDVADLSNDLLKQPIDLYWASSPCQDFSLAGKGLGLQGAKGGVFETWLSKVREAAVSGFAPPIIAFENVVGLVTRRQGADFVHVVRSLVELGYVVGAMEIDASAFLPQSRPRLFVVAVRQDIDVGGLVCAEPTGVFHTARLARIVESLPGAIRSAWRWWAHAAPRMPNLGLAELLDDAPDTKPLTEAALQAVMAIMAPPSRARLDRMIAADGLHVATLYKRGRPDDTGQTRQRAEIRADGLAGCLRTPGGGSSRQTILTTQDGKLSARLLSTRELCRLMGLPESYKMPTRYNDAYRVAGDGVVVPVVRYLDEQLFGPILGRAGKSLAA